MSSFCQNKSQSNVVVLRPQKGKQELFCASRADLCIYGGAAGGGKTYGIALESLRYKNVPKYTCGIFRRNYKQIFDPGGLWALANDLYPKMDGRSNISRCTWSFPSSSSVSFHSLALEKDKHQFQGSQFCDASNTRVYTASGDLVYLRDIRVGDEVMTLDGAKRVVRVCEPRVEECIAIFSGKELLQVCSLDHKILASAELGQRLACQSPYHGSCSQQKTLHIDPKKLSWKFEELKPSQKSKDLYRQQEASPPQSHSGDHDTLAGSSHILSESHQPLTSYATLCHKSCSTSKQSICRPQEHLQPHEDLYSRLLQGEQSFLKVLGNMGFEATFWCTFLQCLDIVTEGLMNTFPMLAQFFSTPALATCGLPLHYQKNPSFEACSEGNEFFYAQTSKQPEDSQSYCSVCSHLCDEQLHDLKDNDQDSFQQQVYAAPRIQISQPSDDMGKAPKCNRPLLRYVHPYIGTEHSTEVEYSIDLLTCKPFGLCEIIPITIESSSHYITEAGLVSRNCAIFFDELTHFTESQFWYMFSRNRSLCGVRPYIRATCNPQTEGFVRDLVDWWIGSDGFPIESRCGVVRYFVRENEELMQFNSLEDIPIKLRDQARSISFINSNVYDNKILLESDPGYLSNLKSLPRYDREQLLNGNWNVRREAGMYFRSHWFEIVDQVPKIEQLSMRCCRYWDRAATTPKEGIDPDYTAGVKVGRCGDTYYVMDVVRFRETPMSVARAIKNCAIRDGNGCTVGLEQEGGASGIAECDYLKRDLNFPNVAVARAEKSKEWRCKPVSAASEQGRVKIVAGAWNKAFIAELENFPLGAHDDQVDALAGAFNMLDTVADYSVYKKLGMDYLL